MKPKTIIGMALALILLSVIAYSFLDTEVVIDSPPATQWNQAGTINVNFTVNCGTMGVGNDTLGSCNGSYSCSLIETWTVGTNYNWTLNGTTSVANDTTGNISVTGIQTSTGNGWLYYINCTNVSNNVKSAYRYFKVDLTNPVVLIKSPTNGTTQTNSSLAVRFYANDSNPELCELYLDGIKWNDSRVYANNVEDGFQKHSLSDGIHLANAICTDKSGRTGTQSTNLSVRIDTTAPSLTNATPSTSWLTSGAINYTVKVLEANGIVNCTLSGNWNGTWLLNQTDTSVANDTNTNFSLVNVADRVNGYAANLTCIDNAGLSAVTSFNVSVDSVVPDNVSLLGPANDSTYTDFTPTFVWANSTDSNFDHYTLWVYNSSGVVLQAHNVTTKGTENSSLTVNLTTEQTYLWNVTVYDKAGNKNVSTESWFTYKTDKTCADLVAGWNYCGLKRQGLTNLSTIAAEITGATSVASFNSSKSLKTYNVGATTNADVQLYQGDVVLIYVSAAAVWEYDTWSTNKTQINITLTNTTTPWNYFAVKNQSGASFQAIEDWLGTAPNSFTSNTSVAGSTNAIDSWVTINATGIQPYIYGFGEPWNSTFVDYGEVLYMAVDYLNSSISLNRDRF